MSTAPVLQTSSFWATSWTDVTEVGIGSLTVPDPGWPYVVDVSATVGLASTAGVGVASRIRVDDVTGLQLGVDGFRSGALPAGEVIATIHPGVTSPVLTGSRRIVVTAQRIVGSGTWANSANGNFLRVVVRQATNPLAVLGDSYPAGHNGAGLGVRGFPYLVGLHLGGDCLNLAVGGTGYVNAAGGATIPQRAAAIPSQAKTVLVFGSLNDQTLPPDQVQAAASQTYATAAQNAPGARLVVVGPQWPNAQRPADLMAVSAAVKTAATNAGALFIDPLAEQWFDNHPELIGPDGWHPTDAGHAYIADKINAHL